MTDAALPFAAPPDLLATLLSVSLTGVILFRPQLNEAGELHDFAYEYLNPAAQRMLQLPERPAESFLMLYPHAAGDTGVLAFYRDTFLAGTPGRLDVNYQHDGLDNYFHLAAQRSGELLVVSFTDTADHERSQVEKALREAQQREQEAAAAIERQRDLLQALLAQAPVAIGLFHGPDQKIVTANSLLCTMWGYAPEQVLGRPLLEAVPELQGQGFAELLAEVARTRVPHVGTEVPARLQQHGQLETRYFNFVYQPLYDAADNLLGVVDIAIDVTPQVLARQQVQELNEELAAANEEMQAANEELRVNNTELLLAQGQLQQLTQELEVRVEQRTREARAARAEAEQQRARLERLFTQAPAAICILAGEQLVYELVNPGYQELFPGRELLGRPLLAAMPEIGSHVVYRTFRRVYETGITHQEQAMHIPLARPTDGVLEDRYFNFVLQARFDEQRRIDGVVAFAFEVTTQVQARQASEAAARQLRLITDALPVLIGYVDCEEHYQFVNQAYVEWFHLQPEKLIGRPVREIVGEKAYEGVKQYIDRALAGERLQFEARMPYREGFVRFIRTDYIPDVHDGRVAGFYSLINDVTEQVLARQLVADANEQLRTSNSSLDALNQQLTRTNIDLDNFIYTASHDLKAPITNMEGLLQALTEQLPPEARSQDLVQPILDLMQDAIGRFLRTIDYLTDVSKLQQEFGKATGSVTLTEVVADVEQDLRPLLLETNARLHIDVANCPPLAFSPKNLRSVVYNLLSNALKYRAPDRVPEVSLTCRPAEGFVVLSVQDNGLGLNLRQQAKVFGMFQRLHTHVEGSGIGLYMVKKIVENAGGTIAVQSQPGEGSTFSITLPV